MTLQNKIFNWNGLVNLEELLRHKTLKYIRWPLRQILLFDLKPCKSTTFFLWYLEGERESKVLSPVSWWRSSDQSFRSHSVHGGVPRPKPRWPQVVWVRRSVHAQTTYIFSWVHFVEKRKTTGYSVDVAERRSGYPWESLGDSAPSSGAQKHSAVWRNGTVKPNYRNMSMVVILPNLRSNLFIISEEVYFKNWGKKMLSDMDRKYKMWVSSQSVQFRCLSTRSRGMT